MPTTSISLIREHTDKVQPPRALWVPFDLGRPFGAPNEPEFQLDVLRAALALFDRERGPVLEDYPHDAPAGEGDPWACPVALPPPPPPDSEAEALARSIESEVALLRPWYDESTRSLGRSAVGLSGLGADAITEIATCMAAFASGAPLTALEGTADPMPQLLRFLADDLKAFYYEAAAAQPGRASPGRASPSATELSDWLFGDTVLGDVLYRLRDRLAASDDPREKATVGGIIPFAYVQRPDRSS